MAKASVKADLQRDRDEIDALASVLIKATIGAYIEMFPTHDGATELLRAHPELKIQGDHYYRSIARRLIKAGIKLPPTHQSRNQVTTDSSKPESSYHSGRPQHD